MAFASDARYCGQLRPGCSGQAAIFGKTFLAEHIGVNANRAVESRVMALHFAGKEVACECNRIGPHCAGRREVDVARPF